ncbi:hypothetical protein MCOR27_004740 [Pyricularia oryzae]|nr:hypothetical protein MCOR02_010529 [Pyricularia oryzae]KAI6261343.1 hypothetical protein MCOR19_002378 [Pyricularia oryzae]KAI6280320.1 hypothetical protein MCOR27_004740 [Pyricularia oryzae]KAI6321922.1 hypothetical protein MCOR34_002394 [Pyricularia oryzae]KAI6347888.1 hypothetical protein MCOR28_002057 [Pyricularia oryzae]
MNIRSSLISASIQEAVSSPSDATPRRNKLFRLLFWIIEFLSLLRLRLTRYRHADFRALRKHVWKLDEDEYLGSFQPGAGALKPVGDLGYSGSTFFTTANSKYLIKSLPRRFEHQFFTHDLLEPYIGHMRANPHSLLVRIADMVFTPQATLGGILGTAPTHHIVMENLMYGKQGDGWETYDLKPNDYFFPERDIMDGALVPNSVLDKLVDEFKDKVKVTAEQKAQLLNNLEKDTDLLSRNNAIDYSLFLVRYPADAEASVISSDADAWRTGMKDRQGKWVYRVVVLDFFWARHKFHARAMTGLVKLFNKVAHRGPMSITANPSEYRERFLGMVQTDILTTDFSDPMRAHLPHRRRVLTWLGYAISAGVIFWLLYIVVRLLAFAQLFGKLGPHAGIAVTQSQVLEAHANHAEPVIPRIIHQIYHNWKDPTSKQLPEDWEAARQTCIDKNPGWDVKVGASSQQSISRPSRLTCCQIWHSQDSLAFIANEYPWFLSTYEGYKYPIQRVDVMRYFLVRKYGGIYIDLDNGCEASLEPFRSLPAFTTDGGLGALSNNIIGAQPEHPWTRMLTENLEAYNWNWLLPYARVMYNSGQWYLTAMWEQYHARLREGSVAPYPGSNWAKLHRVMMDEREGADRWVFWNHAGHGGTWGAGDDWFWAWLGRHWIEAVVEAIAAVVALLTSFACCLKCARRRRLRRIVDRGYKYAKVEDDVDVELLGGRYC